MFAEYSMHLFIKYQLAFKPR